jgi:glycosyltransferase involved in cell wall biosynthesis
MAMGVPVVSTTVGAEGLGADAGQQLLLADSPAEMAAAVIQLFKGPETADRMRQRAAVWVRQHYDWQSLRRAAELKAEEFFASSGVPGTAVSFSHSAQTTTLR